ncbi:MAG: hypothetical protein HYV63_04805 [Candidatus Schekmanbacteria bacterium]|nr:hypothetical protein [Candidatus Schekmanbacteria bacterium]
MGLQLFDGIVEIGRFVRYTIHSTERRRAGMGALVSRTVVNALEGTVTVYDSGIVVIDSPRGRLHYDLRDGNISAGS